MSWLVAVVVLILLFLLLMLLARSFVINARTLTRDVNARFDQFRTSLEQDANAMLDDFFDAAAPPADTSDGRGRDRA